MVNMTCAIYIRKSREDKDKPGHRLNVQREQLPAHAIAKGWDPHIYDDGHASAARGKVERLPERNRLEQDIKAGKVDVVLVIELSRLSRDDTGIDYLQWIAICADHNVKLATPEQILDPNDLSHRFLLGITGNLSSHEMQQITKRMREGRQQAIRAGKYVGGKLCPPYVQDAHTKEIIVDQKKLDHLKQILTLAETKSAAAIAKEKGLAEITIRRMISDQRLLTYQGLRQDPETGEPIDGPWPPIIDAERAERIRTARRTRKSTGPARKVASLLTNMRILYCGYCGKTIKTWRNSKKRKDGTQPNYYGCTAKPGCKQCRLINQQILDQRVIANITGTLERTEELQLLWHKFNSGGSQAEIEKLNQDLTGEQQKKSRLVNAITEGVISFADAKEKRKEIESRISAIELQIKQATAEVRQEPDWDKLRISREEFVQLKQTTQRPIIKSTIQAIKLYSSYAIITYRFPRTNAGSYEARIKLPPAQRGTAPGLKPRFEVITHR